MDNLTHSLIGVAIGDAVARRQPYRKAAVLTGVIASNLPDLDLVARPFFADPKLGYLVHHRGHTHTLPVALLLAPLAVGLGLAFTRGRWGALDARARRDLALTSGLGLLLHLGADAWNNYGVHPFWPLSSRWFYGDAIFIIEPLLLAALLPYALLSSRAKAARAGWGLALLLVLGLAWGTPGLPWSAGLGTTALALGMLALQRAGARLGATLAAAGLVLTTFFLGSRAAEATVAARVAARWPADRPLDVMVTPTPATPLCWSFIAQTEPGPDRRRLLSGTLSLAPGWLDAEDCALRAGSGRTAPLQPIGGAEPGLAWEGELALDVGALRAVAAADCRVEAFLRFGRVPTWTREGDALILGDLRYDFEPEVGWSELALRPEEAWTACGPYLAPWIPDSVRALEAGLPSP